MTGAEGSSVNSFVFKYPRKQQIKRETITMSSSHLSSKGEESQFLGHHSLSVVALSKSSTTFKKGRINRAKSPSGKVLTDVSQRQVEAPPPTKLDGFKRRIRSPGQFLIVTRKTSLQKQRAFFQGQKKKTSQYVRRMYRWPASSENTSRSRPIAIPAKKRRRRAFSVR